MIFPSFHSYGIGLTRGMLDVDRSERRAMLGDKTLVKAYLHG